MKCQNELETARKIERIYKATLKYFKEEPKVQKYLAGFQQESVERNLESYALQKARWVVNREYEEYWYNYFLLLSKSKAEKALSHIQQKKLFDKQCEWRAGIFSDPLIESTYDFYYWEHNILNCPFIEPITKEDIDLYADYLKEYLGEHLSFLASWQDYDTYCTNKLTVAGSIGVQLLQKRLGPEEAGTGDETAEELRQMLIPPWYMFWEARRGGSQCRLLSDKRGPEEWKYVGIAQDYQKEQIKQLPKDLIPSLPYFSLSIFKEGEVGTFIKEYENPAEREETLKAYDTYMKAHWKKEGFEEIQKAKEALHELDDCVDFFPMAGGAQDWKQALITTAKQWEHHKIIAELPSVYEEYLFRLVNGIVQPFDEKQAATYRRMAEQQKENVLLGKRLCGTGPGK